MKLFDIVFTLINSSMTIYLAAFLLSIFAKKKYPRITMIVASLFLSLLLCLTLLFSTHYLMRLVFIFAITFTLSFLYDIKWYNRILLSIINYAIGGASEYVVLTLVSVIFSVELEKCYAGGLLVLGMLLSKVFLFLIESFLKIQKHRVLHQTNSKHYLIVLAPFSSMLIFLLQYRFYLSKESFNNQLSWMDLVCNTILVVFNIVVFNIIDEICNSAEKDAKLRFTNKLLEQQEQQYQELYDHNKAIYKMKHDHKNFLLGVLSNLETAKYADIEDRIKEELKIIDTSIVPAKHHNLIYLLVNHKIKEAENSNVVLNSEFHEIHKIKIPSIDLAILLGNALDNAIEAVQKFPCPDQRIVSLFIKVHGEQIIIIIKNPIMGNIDVNDLRTQKASEHHGFGILSMKNIVDTYHGDIIFSVEDGIFNTRIIIKNTNE